MNRSGAVRAHPVLVHSSFLLLYLAWVDVCMLAVELQPLGDIGASPRRKFDRWNKLTAEMSHQLSVTALKKRGAVAKICSPEVTTLPAAYSAPPNC